MLPKLPDFSLSFEQQFSLQKYKQLIQDIPRSELEALTLQIMQLQMAHENLAKGLMKECTVDGPFGNDPLVTP